MQRRDFLRLAGVGAGGILLPVYGTRVTAAELIQNGMDVRRKKALADIVLNTARKRHAPAACQRRRGASALWRS
ncbi:hypothetical protein [Microbulbifer sediminum]|uniref:hypothetical protein n=1 Tax=Microbulbifer sediminum TaxID=2904250 RepID=UPI001F446871|nr:hypothetical protein [Microbulbifer sediminum]